MSEEISVIECDKFREDDQLISMKRKGKFNAIHSRKSRH